MELERTPGRLARIDLRSPAFGSGHRIPERHALAGGNASPPLRWTQVPPDTQSFALLCEALVAGRTEPFVHWLLYDVPGACNELPEGVSPVDRPPEIAGAAQGRNDFGTVGYRGPEGADALSGRRTYFRIYALDRPLRLQPGALKSDLFDAMAGHALGYGEFVGVFGP